MRHRERFCAGIWIGSVAVRDITRTGALWNDPIDSAEFLVSPRTAAHGWSWPDGFRFAGFEEHVGDQVALRLRAYRFTAKDWTPTWDFVVALCMVGRWPVR